MSESELMLCVPFRVRKRFLRFFPMIEVGQKQCVVHWKQWIPSFPRKEVGGNRSIPVGEKRLMYSRLWLYCDDWKYQLSSWDSRLRRSHHRSCASVEDTVCCQELREKLLGPKDPNWDQQRSMSRQENEKYSRPRFPTFYQKLLIPRSCTSYSHLQLCESVLTYPRM